MVKEKILVIGASGQIGVELTLALRKIYSHAMQWQNKKPPARRLKFHKCYDYYESLP